MRKRILVIDDERALAGSICDYLEALGHQCTFANEKAEAMTMLAHDDFDVLLTDISLSGATDSDGLDIASHIRNANLPMDVVIMTAHETAHYESDAERLGARLLRKPIALAQLARLIEEGRPTH